MSDEAKWTDGTPERRDDAPRPSDDAVAKPADGGAQASRWPVEPRDMKTDPKAMRALAHPVRVALLEELAVTGELTATEAAERVGESPANCSFHLRQLAKYGFVEEAGTGRGRNRPWRLMTVSMHFDTVGAEAEPQAAVAMDQLTSIFLDRALERVRLWFRTRNGYPAPWRKAAQTQSIWWVTPEELAELSEEITALAFRYFERFENPELRPPGALPVEFLAFAFPVQAPPADEHSGSDGDRGAGPAGGTADTTEPPA